MSLAAFFVATELVLPAFMPGICMNKILGLQPRHTCRNLNSAKANTIL
jgi:hypothetical protein